MPTTKQAKLEVYILTFGSRAPHNFTYKIARIVRRNECITIPHDIVWYLDAEKLDLGINSLFVFEVLRASSVPRSAQLSLPSTN